MVCTFSRSIFLFTSAKDNNINPTGDYIYTLLNCLTLRNVYNVDYDILSILPKRSRQIGFCNTLDIVALVHSVITATKKIQN